MNSLDTTFESILPEIQWPPIPTPISAQLLTVLNFLEKSQWLDPEKIKMQQMKQIYKVIQQAVATVPHYKMSLSSLRFSHDEEMLAQWEKIPILTRQILQSAGKAFFSVNPLNGHGANVEHFSSGSTGRAVSILTNDATSFFSDVFLLREHLWHRRDFQATLGIIKFSSDPATFPPSGKKFDNWGIATKLITKTGPCMLLGNASIVEAAEWVKRVDPDYLLCFPSVLKGLIRHFNEHNIKLSRLREIRTVCEIVEPELRTDVKKFLNVKLTDVYTAAEVGTIAMQCPEHEHYHIQSENVFLELINDEGQQCQPGEMGKVVITSLNNFSSPFIRYEIGDYAVFGEQCSCGRGLPVLSRVFGRQRNLITFPNGKKKAPAFGNKGIYLKDLFKNSQYQLIQHSIEHIEVKVTCAPNSPAIEAELEKKIQLILGHTFRITFTYLPNIPRDPSGKYEDFKSLIN